MALWANYQRASFLLAGTRAIAQQRDLVQWNLTQMREHNIESNGEYMKPLLMLKQSASKWGSLTAGLSAEELADMEGARANLEHYEKTYQIFEYCAELNRTMNVLQTRMAGSNPTLAMNMYRFSEANSV